MMDASENKRADEQETVAAPSVLHRACIRCNNMFRVPPGKFDAKQCPNCHKG